MADNYFGLGFVLSVEDNASRVFGNVNSSMQTLMQTSEQTFMSMNMAGMALSQMGDSAMSLGTKLGSGIIAMGKNIISTGDDFEKTRLTLEALYKSSEVGEQKMRWLMDYSARTPFEIKDLKSAMIGLKAIGIDVDQMVTSVSGYRQELMGFVGDLGALRPDVGMQKITYAIRNALGGNIRSLNQVLDIDSEKVLGRKFGKSGNNAQDIADLVSKMNAEGLMTKLNGTWTQMISNLKDQVTKFWLAIADGGAFNKAKDTLKYISTAINGIDYKIMKTLGEALSGAFTMIWTPVDWVVRRIVDFSNALVTLTESNPILAKIVLGFLGISSVLLITTGLLLKMSGGVLMALGGLGMLATTIMRFGGLGNIFALIGTSIGTMIASMLPTVAVIGLIFLAWKENFIGIRSMSITFVQNTRLAFQEATRIARLNSQEMGLAVDKLDKKSFFGGLTLAIVKLIVLWDALVDAWGDNALSTENFEKAQKLGLLPIIEFVLDLKANLERLWQGFKDGMNDVLSVAKVVVGGLIQVIVGIGSVIAPVIGWIAEVVFHVNRVSGEGFNALGYALGIIAGVLTTYKIGSLIIGIGTSLWGVVSASWAFTASLLANPITWIVLGVVALIAGIVLLVKHWSEVKQAVSGFVTYAVNGLKSVGQTIANFFMPMIAPMIPFFKTLANVGGMMIGGLGTVFKAIGGVIKSVFLDLVFAGKLFFSILASGVAPVINTFKNLWNTISTGLGTLGKAIGSAVTNILGKFSGLVTAIRPIFTVVATVFGAIYSVIQRVLASIIAIATPILSGFVRLVTVYFGLCLSWTKTVFGLIFNTIANIFGAVFTFITSTLTNIVNIISSMLGGALRIVTGILQAVWGVISNVVMMVVNIFRGQWKEAFNNFTNIFTSAWTGLQNIFGGLVEFFGGLINGVIDAFKSAGSLILDVITSPFKGAMNYIKGFVDDVLGMVNKVKDIGGNIASGISGGFSKAKSFLGFATGAEIYGEGAAVLHPGEVVVNGDLTQKLRTFLNSNSPQGGQSNATQIKAVHPQANNPTITSVAQATSRGNASSSATNPSMDNSVKFEAGSIQITMTNGNEADVNKLVKMIADKLQRQAHMSRVRNYQPI